MAGTALLIAHRGGAARPEHEHTLASCSRALAFGAHALEVDVRLSADGALVLWHDSALVDCTGRSWSIRNTTVAQLRQHWPALLQLETVLERFGSRSLLVLDLKDVAAVPPLARLLTTWPYPERILVTAQRAATLRRLSWMAPQVTYGLSRGHAVHHLTRLGAVGRRAGQLTLALQLWLGVRLAGCRALSIHHRLVQPPLLQLAQRSGLAILAWTVDHPTEARRLAHVGVCGVTTNEVGRLATLSIWRADQPTSWLDVIPQLPPAHGNSIPAQIVIADGKHGVDCERGCCHGVATDRD